MTTEQFQVKKKLLLLFCIIITTIMHANFGVWSSVRAHDCMGCMGFPPENSEVDGKFIWGIVFCLLYRGDPLLRGSTVIITVIIITNFFINEINTCTQKDRGV